MYEVREIYNAETFDLTLDFVVKNCRVTITFLMPYIVVSTIFFVSFG